MNTIEHLSKPAIWAPTLLCVLAYVAYRHYEGVYKYWDKRNIVGVKPLVPVLSELWEILTRDRMHFIQDRTRQFGSKVYGAFFNFKPVLIVADAETIRRVTIKDFDSFQDHKLSEWVNKYQRHFLIALKSQHWRRVRALMTPTFTSGKIKRMFNLLDACAQDMVENFSAQIEKAGNSRALVDLFDIIGLYTMNGITTCCYGLKLKREENLETASSRNAFVRDASCVFRVSLWRVLPVAVVPKWLLRLLKYEQIPTSVIRPLAARVEHLVEMRRNGIGHKYDDLLQLLVDANLNDKMELNEMDAKENHHAGLTCETQIEDHKKLKDDATSQLNGTQKRKVQLDDLEVISESILMLAAGLDTTRSSLSSICYFLAHNPHVQERLYREVSAIAKEQKDSAPNKKFTFDYESLTSCDYLDAVISETLRMFGPAPMVDRVANEDYYLEKYNLHLSKGSHLFLALHAVQNDPDYWEKPDQFNPDRFLPGQREKIVPGSYAPFGMGPRHCIGMRFSLTETKIGLAKIIMHFNLEPAPGTDYPPKPRDLLGLISIKNNSVYASPRE